MGVGRYGAVGRVDSWSMSNGKGRVEVVKFILLVRDVVERKERSNETRTSFFLRRPCPEIVTQNEIEIFFVSTTHLRTKPPFLSHSTCLHPLPHLKSIAYTTKARVPVGNQGTKPSRGREGMKTCENRPRVDPNEHLIITSA